MRVFQENIERYGFDEMDVMSKTNLDLAAAKKTFNGF